MKHFSAPQLGNVQVLMCFASALATCGKSSAAVHYCSGLTWTSARRTRTSDHLCQVTAAACFSGTRNHTAFADYSLCSCTSRFAVSVEMWSTHAKDKVAFQHLELGATCVSAFRNCTMKMNDSKVPRGLTQKWSMTVPILKATAGSEI